MLVVSLDIALRTPVQKTGKRSRSTARRLENIKWVAELNRNGLIFGENEKELLLASTPSGEGLAIRFPGKESGPNRKSPKPWDFRPKLIRPDGTYGADMSFFDIWDALYNEIEPRKAEIEEESRALATLFYRMAHMIDYERSQSAAVQATAIDAKTGAIGKRSKEALPTFWAYAPPQPPLHLLRRRLPKFGSVSLEAFLRYNDLLAWNEDCKYYYRDTLDGQAWKPSGTGRINNLLTHVTVIILGDVSFAKTLGRASQQRGVAPATGPEALQICRPFLTKEGPAESES